MEETVKQETAALDETRVNELISNHPEIVRILEFSKEYASDKQQREEELKRAAVDEEIRKIGALDSNIKSFRDLIDMENAEEFMEKVNKGYSLSDAYFLVNGKKLMSRAAGNASRAAINKLNSKNHLRGVLQDGAQTPVDVPAETLMLYRSMFPEMSEDAIRKHYAKHK